MAVLLMNNDDVPARLSFKYADLPGEWANVSSCAVYDVWQRAPLGRIGGGAYAKLLGFHVIGTCVAFGLCALAHLETWRPTRGRAGPEALKPDNGGSPSHSCAPPA